jgi:hypothetical protein
MPYSMTDTVKVPNAAGRYILSWRWDCEQTYVFRISPLSLLLLSSVWAVWMRNAAASVALYVCRCCDAYLYLQASGVELVRGHRDRVNKIGQASLVAVLRLV